MSLTAEQMAERKGKLTASRVACLMTGDTDAIMRLYREMIGELEPEDLRKNWSVQLGSITEALQLNWYVDATGRPLEWRNRVILHKEFDWAAATPDGWDAELQCPVECKHVMKWEQIEETLERFMPQLHWQMWCTGADRAVLSAIRVVSVPHIEYVDRNEEYMRVLVKRASNFIMNVAMKVPPVDMPPIKPPVDPTRVIDMTSNNEWAVRAGAWLDSREMYENHQEAKDELKGMVPADARRAFGHGVQVTRAKNGALTVRVDT